MICFSLTGQDTGERLRQGLTAQGDEAVLEKKSRYLPDSVEMSCSQWAKEKFQTADAVIFLGACGIAVRSIAPYIASKKTDPAVLVIDECGKYVISLLSGHLGGANALAERAARILGAAPVVTTATDLHHRFAVDVFAKENNCSLFHMKAAKEVSAALLAGEPVGFYSEFPWEGRLPEGLVLCEKGFPPEKEENRPERGIAVTIHRDCRPFLSTVQVVPPVLTLGMGCRRGKDAEAVKKAAEQCLEKNGFYREAVETLASIEIKKEEPGLLALAEAWKLDFAVFSEKQLLEVPGEFTPSAFVQKTVGVDNVCERSAVLASRQGRLIQKKMAEEGATAALALCDWRIHFE